MAANGITYIETLYMTPQQKIIKPLLVALAQGTPEYGNALSKSGQIKQTGVSRSRVLFKSIYFCIMN